MEHVSSAVGFTARLKPEIRLAQAISEFSASLQNKTQRARFKNLHSQSPPSPDDIIRLTEEINRDGARAHRSWRPYGTRLIAILERMRQFAPIGDVLVGGSQNLIACGVWAAVRLSLETSLSFLSYFENVSNMMLRLGRSLSLHKDFAMLFPKCSTLQSYICEYTIVMVNICAKIVHDCAKSALSQLAASLTSTFDAVFKPLESDLATWTLLIEKRTTVLLAKADLQSHSSVLDRFNRLQIALSADTAKCQMEARKHRLFAAMCPDQAEFNLIWRRERKRGTSNWMYEEEAYRNWLSSEVGSVLWLKGNLGSGKTVTMASAVAHLTLAAPTMDPLGAVTVSYFFCQNNNPKTLSATNLLASVIGQVLQNPAMEPSLVALLERPEAMPFHATPEECIDILIKVTPSNWRGIFVLDGLDEISEEVVAEIFHELHRLKDHRWISILCSSRPTSACYSTVKSIFNEVCTLSMETADRSKEIRAYLIGEISRWNAIRPLPTEIEKLMEEQLFAGCQGMFLWLSLQIEDICPRYTQALRSDAEILDILGNLPKDLPGAFDKALSRVKDGKRGSQLLKLVASAEPPMNTDELRVASNVNPGSTAWESSTLIGTGKALISAYGGSLLDIDEEDFRVRFIHYSVLLHLTGPSSDRKTRIFHFALSEAELMLGAVCVTYLSYSVFENRISKAQKASFAEVPEVTARSVMPSETFRKGVNLFLKHRRQRDPTVDLERLSHELQKQRTKVRDDVHLFFDYAKDQWLLSTRQLWRDDQNRVLPLWRDLITNPIVSDSLPWNSVAQAAFWALENNHGTLFQHYLHSKERDNLSVVLSVLTHAVGAGVSHIRLRGDGLGWLGPLYLMSPQYRATIMQAFVKLGCLPHDPALAPPPHANIYGDSLVKNATSHLVACLKIYSKDPEVDAYVLFLANYLPRPDLVLSDGSSILHLAIDRGCISLANNLLQSLVHSEGGYGVRWRNPIKLRNSAGETLLLLAVRSSEQRLTEFLLEHGADPRVGNDRGAQPLHFARSAVIIQHLLRRGADPEAAAGGHVTPLMLAAYQGRAEAVRALLDNGANPNPPKGGVAAKQALLLGWRNTGEAPSWATSIDLCTVSSEQELRGPPGASLEGQSGTAQLCSELEVYDLGAFGRLMDLLLNRDNDADVEADFQSAWKFLTEAIERMLRQKRL